MNRSIYRSHDPRPRRVVFVLLGSLLPLTACTAETDPWDHGSVVVSLADDSAATTREGLKAPMTLAVTLSAAPDADVAVPVASSVASEAVPSVNLLTFGPDDWDVPQLVVVTSLDDDVDDGDQAYAIGFGATSSEDPRFDRLPAIEHAAINEDNDDAGVVVTPLAPAIPSGGEAGLEIRLRSRPRGPVTIELRTDEPKAISIDTGTGEPGQGPARVSFDPVSWNQPRTVTVRAHSCVGRFAVTVSVDADDDVIPAPASAGFRCE